VFPIDCERLPFHTRAEATPLRKAERPTRTRGEIAEFFSIRDFSIRALLFAERSIKKNKQVSANAERSLFALSDQSC